MINQPQTSDNDFFYDLVIEEATQGLNPDDKRTLEQMLFAEESRLDAEEIELTIAALDVANFSDRDQYGSGIAMPSGLYEKLLADGKSFMNDGLKSSELATADADRPAKSDPVVQPRIQSDDRALSTATRWRDLVAAAALVAGILLTCFGLVALNSDGNSIASLTSAEQLEQFQREYSTELKKVSWVQNDQSGGENVSGEVIWSDAKNEGYMVFEGLKVNDPSKELYQLWIFDATRPETTTEPVNGGVFNVDSTGKVVVPIDFTIKTGQVSMFALTIEKPPGVTVSKREKLPVLAQVK